VVAISIRGNATVGSSLWHKSHPSQFEAAMTPRFWAHMKIELPLSVSPGRARVALHCPRNSGRRADWTAKRATALTVDAIGRLLAKHGLGPRPPSAEPSTAPARWYLQACRSPHGARAGGESYRETQAGASAGDRITLASQGAARRGLQTSTKTPAVSVAWVRGTAMRACGMRRMRDSLTSCR
jgi:hypothetical protein